LYVIRQTLQETHGFATDKDLRCVWFYRKIRPRKESE